MGHKYGRILLHRYFLDTRKYDDKRNTTYEKQVLHERSRTKRHQCRRQGFYRYYFCSSPGLFGKTLTVSAFEQIFPGNRELFKNLHIGKSDCGIKFKRNRPAETAVKQIYERGYEERFLHSRDAGTEHSADSCRKCKLHLAGINFSDADKNISEYKEKITEG